MQANAIGPRLARAGLDCPIVPTLPAITDAHPDEAAEYARFLADLFRRTYAHGYDAERLERHIAAHYGEGQQRAELTDPARWTLRAGSPDRWTAFVMVGTGSAVPAALTAARPAEVERFYVGTEAQGSGLAQRLMHAAVARAASRGHDALWLSVWRHNARAKRFYEKVGFVPAGKHPFEFDGVAELDDLYVLPIG